MGKKEAQKYIQMIEDETDPDKIQILELDIQRELGLDPKDLKDDVVKKMGVAIWVECFLAMKF